MRICLTASSGGHLSQLLSISSVWKDYEIFWVSTGEMVRDKLQKMGRTYIVGECNRMHPIKTLGVMIKSLKIVLQEKPDVVISTGAAAGFMICIFGKIFGAKIIWLDSIANTEKLSLSGRMVRYFADLILSQWPNVAEKYSNVEYVGEVI